MTNYTDLKTRLNYARRLYKATGIDGEHGAQMMTEALAAIEELEARVTMIAKSSFDEGFAMAAATTPHVHETMQRKGEAFRSSRTHAITETPNDRH